MNEPFPAAVPAAPAPAPRKNRGRIALLAASIALLLLVAAAFIPVGGDQLWHRALSVYHLRGIYVAQGNSEPVAPYAFGFLGMKPYQVPGAGGILGDFAKSGGTRIAVTRAAEGEPAQLLELAPTQRALTDEPGAKALAAVSPDGMWAAYSIATSTDTFSSRISSWETRLMSLEDGITVTLGAGIGPQFFTRDGATWLLYTNPSGLTVYDVAARKSFTTPFEFADDVGFMAKIAPDGRHIAIRDFASGNSGIYGISQLASNLPLTIVPIPLDVTRTNDVSLADAAVYSVKFVDGINYLYRTPYAHPERADLLYTFPSNAAELGYRLIP